MDGTYLTQKYLTARQWLKWLPSVPLGLRFGSLKRWMLISEQTAIISLCSITWFVFITETECVYCAVQTVFKHDSHSSSFQTCRATTQADSRRPLTADARVQSQVRSFEIYGGQSGTGTGRPPPASSSSFVLSVSFHKYSMLTSSIYTFHLPGQMGEAWEPSREQYQGALNREVSLSNICKLVRGDLTILIEVFVSSRVAIRLKVKPSITSKAVRGIVSAGRTAQTTVPARSRHGVGM
jgi:hypothetical protein